jgi:hypothetical protein
MNKLLNKMLLAGAVAATSTFGLFAENTKALTNQEIMEQMDQSFCFFQTSGKYPTLYKCTPANKELVILLCGTESQGSEIDFVKKPVHLEKLTPLRMKDMSYITGTLLDKKYMRESVTSQTIAKIFQLMHIMPKESYKGQVLWEEVTKGLPMKWSLKNKAELTSLLKYLKNQQVKTNSTISRKPLLALFFLEETVLTDADQDAISQYFELAQTTDANVKEFYKTCDTNLNTFLDYEAKKIVGESWGELTLRQIEEGFCDFDVKKMTAKYASTAVALVLAAIFIETVKPTIRACFTRPIQNTLHLPQY